MAAASAGTIARREFLVLLLMGALFAGGLAFAVVTSRREARDGIRREHLRTIKQSLEMYYNTRQAYPMASADPRTGCTSSTDEHSWFFGAGSPLRATRAIHEFPRDPLSPHDWPYQYCVTETDGQGATAWYLRARLERRLPLRSAFDPEEGHNYYFRVVRDPDGHATHFDICGGTLTCGAPAREDDR